MKDHEIQKIVSDLKNIAIKFGQAQQLREQIGNYIVPILKDWKAEQELAGELAQDEIVGSLKQKIVTIIIEAYMHEVNAIECAEHDNKCEKPVYPVDPFKYADRILKEVENERKKNNISTKTNKS